jgi:MFS family permease
LILRGRKVYYGWFIVAAALCAMFTSSAIQSNSQSVFLLPMTTDLGWSRADFTWGQTIGTFIMSAAGFVVGSMLDARGPRLFMLIGGCCMAASVLAMSQVTELWQYLLLRGIGMTVGSIMIGNLVVNTTVSKWFVRRRAWAIAAATTGLSLGGFVAPLVTTALVESFGWRTSWVILAFALLVLVVPSALVMRRRPEDHGLLPDGDEAGEPPPAAPGQVTAATEVQWTRAEAMQSRSFWLLVVAFCLASFGTGAFSLHMLSYLQDSGYTPGEAAARFSTVYLFTAMSRPLWGSVMQRFPARYCAALGFLTTAACTGGIILSLDAGNSTLLYAFMIGWGTGFGGYVPLQELIWANYFGRQYIGKVRSVAVPILGLASAIGPQLAARIYDSAGSYSYAFLLFATFSAAGALCILMARPPVRRTLAQASALRSPESVSPRVRRAQP